MIEDVHTGVFEDDATPWLVIEIGQGNCVIECSFDGYDVKSFYVAGFPSSYNAPPNWVLA